MNMLYPCNSHKVGGSIHVISMLFFISLHHVLRINQQGNHPIQFHSLNASLLHVGDAGDHGLSQRSHGVGRREQGVDGD